MKLAAFVFMLLMAINDPDNKTGHRRSNRQSSPSVMASPTITKLDHQLIESADHTQCQYSELFYTYRNCLVHEFREPGYGWDVSGTSARPFYMSYLGREGQWELTFPVRFLQNLLNDTIEGVKAHLLRGKIDPYRRFQFGSMWSGR